MSDVTKNSNNAPPLWLPKGSIRAILAILTTATFLYLIATHPDQISQDGFLASLVVIIWERYFQSRVNDSNGKNNL